jgi:CheY-like chemotaxis protein
MVAVPHASKRVLVIDDDFATREMISLLLASDGYRVATACHGADALDRLKSFERPDLIVLDLQMPVMDGCAFCEERKRHPAWAGIPMVVLSALPDGAEQAASVGATAFLQKPVDNLQLLATLRQYCPPAEVAH